MKLLLYGVGGYLLMVGVAEMANVNSGSGIVQQIASLPSVGSMFPGSSSVGDLFVGGAIVGLTYWFL